MYCFLVSSYLAIGSGFVMFRVWDRAAIRPSQPAENDEAENDEADDEEADDEEGGEEEEENAMDPTVEGSLPSDKIIAAIK